MIIKIKSYKYVFFVIMNVFFSVVGFNVMYYGKISDEYSLLNLYNELDVFYGFVLKLRLFKLYSD